MPTNANHAKYNILTRIKNSMNISAVIVVSHMEGVIIVVVDTND